MALADCRELNEQICRLILRTRTGVLQASVEKAYSALESLNPAYFVTTKIVTLLSGTDPVRMRKVNRWQEAAGLAMYIGMLSPAGWARYTILKNGPPVRASVRSAPKRAPKSQAVPQSSGSTAMVLVPKFRNTRLAWEHYFKHSRGVIVKKRGKLRINSRGVDVPEFQTKKAYDSAARAFHSGSPKKGVMEKIQKTVTYGKDGKIKRVEYDYIRFDPKTGYFGVRTPDGVIRTFFRPAGDAKARLLKFHETKDLVIKRPKTQS